MNEFERTIKEYMYRRGIETYRELHALMADAGYVVDYERLRRHIRGDWTMRARPTRINTGIAKSLNLSEGQKTRLARANVPGLFAE